MKKIKYFSTFSGIGGFELGIENAAQKLGLVTECVGFQKLISLPSRSMSIISQMPRIMVILNKLIQMSCLSLIYWLVGFPAKMLALSVKEQV